MAEIDKLNKRSVTVFLHFFDVHFLEVKQADLYRDAVTKEARIATRFSVLWGDRVLVPAASYFESDICGEILSEFQEIYDTGIIRLVGSAHNIKEFVYRKLQQYDKTSSQHKKYLAIDYKNIWQ